MRIDVLARDDFAGAAMEAGERNDLLELLGSRVGAKAALNTSQLELKAWHAWLYAPTMTGQFCRIPGRPAGHELQRHFVLVQEAKAVPQKDDRRS